jgi:hypothetical protein
VDQEMLSNSSLAEGGSLAIAKGSNSSLWPSPMEAAWISPVWVWIVFCFLEQIVKIDGADEEGEDLILLGVVPGSIASS